MNAGQESLIQSFNSVWVSNICEKVAFPLNLQSLITTPEGGINITVKPEEKLELQAAVKPTEILGTALVSSTEAGGPLHSCIHILVLSHAVMRTDSYGSQFHIRNDDFLTERRVSSNFLLAPLGPSCLLVCLNQGFNYRQIVEGTARFSHIRCIEFPDQGNWRLYSRILKTLHMKPQLRMTSLHLLFIVTTSSPEHRFLRCGCQLFLQSRKKKAI